MIIFSFLLKFLRFNSIIIRNSHKNYNNFINIYYLNVNKNLILNNYYPRYNWYNQHNDYRNKINFNYFFNRNKISFNKNISLNPKTPLYEIIELKRKSSIFKKNSDYNYLILNYINQLKINFDKNNNLKKKDINKNRLKFFIKNVDISRKLKLVFKDNRKILKTFFNLKYYRNTSLSKNIKKIANFNKYDMISSMEYNIINIVMKSDFFISIKDCLWFLDNSFISVNSKIVKNPKFVIKPLDIVNISHSSYYFKFYKKNYNNSINNLYKINLKLWSINKNRSKNLNLKESYPRWIDNYKYYKKDIPINIEVDYISMSMTILYFNKKVSDLNYLNLKFINIYLNRLYNWKYII